MQNILLFSLLFWICSTTTGQDYIIYDVPLPGEILINQFSPDYNTDADEYVELVNTTNKTFDLGLLEIQYQSASGIPGTAGGILSGIILPYQYFLLSPKPIITAGLTSNMLTDCPITSGFSSANGQIVLKLISSGIIIDGLAYGDVTVNNFGVGMPASNPMLNGGLIRSPEGNNTGSNYTDFVSVANDSIYLHNHNSLIIKDDYVISGGLYTDITLSGGNPHVTLGGNLYITGKFKVITGNLTVGSAQNLTIGGDANLHSNPSIILKSDVSGTASLIDNGYHGGGSVIIERYLIPDEWHYVSSPVSDAKAATFYGDYIRTSDPATPDGWAPYLSDPLASLQVMRGYACWKPSGNTYSEYFSGVPNTGNHAITINRTSTDPWAGWHLVGNPYPSSIDLTNGISWEKIESTAYFWDPVAGNYLVYPVSGAVGTHSQYCPPGQGFFVHLDETAGNINTTLTFSNLSRIHDNGIFLKEAEGLKDLLILSVKGTENEYSDKMIIHLIDSTSAGFDKGFDGYKLTGSPDAPQIWTTSGDKKLTINSQPLSEDLLIPVSFSCGYNGKFEIIPSETVTFDPAVQILLEDKKLNTKTDLRRSTCIFSYSTTDSTNRFMLHFFNPTAISYLKKDDNLNIWSSGREIIIRPEDGKFRSLTAEVYDMKGMLIIRKELSGNLMKLNIDGAAGHYVVRVIDRESTCCIKFRLD